MNFICIKQGDKYSSDYVNILYNMLERFASPFTLYCMTDDPRGISSKVSILPFKDDSLEKWWCKMWALDYFVEGENILLDLDIIIQNKLSILETYPTQRLNVLHAYWKKREFGFEVGNTLYNSSIMKWTNKQGKKVSDVFFKNPEYYMFKYKGIDRFLWNENLMIDTLPHNIAYSYINNNEKFNPSYSVCIFNETDKKQSELKDTWISQYWN